MALQIAQILVQAKDDIYEEKAKIVKRVVKGKKIAFRLYTSTPLHEVMDKIAQNAWKIPREALEFDYLGTVIQDKDTLETLQIHDGDIIHVRNKFYDTVPSSLSQDFKKLVNSKEGADFIFKVGSNETKEKKNLHSNRSRSLSLDDQEEDEKMEMDGLEREEEIGYKEIYVHRCILRLRSEKFRGMFDCGMKEKEIGFARIPHHTPRIFLSMLTYLYTDELPALNSMTREDVWDLIVLADEYLLPRLVRLAEIRLLSLIDETNVCELYQHCDQYGMEDLKSSCKQFILKHAPKLQQTGSSSLFLTELQKMGVSLTTTASPPTTTTTTTTTTPALHIPTPILHAPAPHVALHIPTPRLIEGV